MGGARSTALLGLVLLLTAALFDAESLYVPGVAFVAAASFAVVWVLTGVRGLAVERRLGTRRVIEDQPLAVELVVSSDRLTLPSCAVEDELLPAPEPIEGGGRTATVRVSVRFGHRGRRVLAPPSVIVRDPLGLASRAVAGTGADEILVLPRVEPVTVPGGDAGEAATLTRRLRPGVVQSAAVDFDGLRPQREGAPASRIHWPAVARTGEMIERRMRPEGDTRPLVVLDTVGAPADVDAAVRAAASLCVRLAHAGGCALLLAGDRRPTPLEPGLAGWPHLHARLAVLEIGASPPLHPLVSRRGPIFFVAARADAQAPRALLQGPASARFLVVPGTVAGRTATFEVAGCSGYEVLPGRRRGVGPATRDAAA